jgi:hypothetical protein
VERIRELLEIELPASRLLSVVAAANTIMDLPTVGSLPAQVDALEGVLGEL